MDTARLYFSFLHIQLENFPEGTFRRRRITPVEAKRSIEQARRTNTLLCVRKNDVLAPFHQRELERHEAIFQALKDTCGIALSEEDFLTPPGAADGVQISTPLFFAEVRDDSRLIVVTWSYLWNPDISAGRDIEEAFTLDPSTIAFHLFEQV